MRRMSARTIIAVPWIASLILVFAASRAGWGYALLTAAMSIALCIAIANLFARAFRNLKTDIRSGLTPTLAQTNEPEEFSTLRSSINSLTQELAARAVAGASEQHLLAVTESITEGILQVNENARFVHVNAAARDMLSLPQEVKGQPAAALIRNPDLRLVIERAASGRQYESVELAFEDRSLLVSPRPFRPSGRDSNVSGAVFSIVDLTEIRRLENVRRDFVANVSHELKTPLTSIRGYAETLLTDELPPEMQRQFLEVVQRNAERIQRIVDDLLDLSRLQSGGWQPELQEVNPAALAEDVWAGCESARKKNIDFQVILRDQRDVIADPGGLRQILSNLFDNAIRYTPENGHVKVTIARNSLNDVEVAITDNGSGIPREALPRIFERFYRVDPARSRLEGGTGLGLSIVKHLAERMSGDVSAESDLGKGTTVRVRLPASTP